MYSKKAVPFWISSRMGLSIMAFFGFVNLYALRVNMSVAIVCMVNHTAVAPQASLDTNTSVGSSESICSDVDGINGTAKLKDGEFVWDKLIQGQLLGSFFWGYIVTQIPGGWISARFGGKHVYGWSMGVCALATLVMPVAARVSPYFLMVLRVLAGLCQGVVWPAQHYMWGHWAPPMERSLLAGSASAGAQVGNVVTLPLAAMLCDTGIDGGWPLIFYVLGGLGLVWFGAWMLIAFDRPAVHPRISTIERDYIEDSLSQSNTGHNHQTQIPWKDILKSKPVWAIIVTHTCSNWGIYTFLTNIPSYMREVLQFDIKSNGFLSSIPYIGMWIIILISGVIADRLRRLGWLTATRKLFVTLGHILPAIFCIILGYVDCRHSIAGVVLLTFGVAFIGCEVGGGFLVNHMDIAPQYASILMGLSNTAATIPGFLAPYVVSVITQNRSQEEWRMVFYICSAIFSFGAFFYLLFGSGELQPWADQSSKNSTSKNVGEMTSSNNL